MKLANIKIGVKLGALSGILLLAVVSIGIGGQSALSLSSTTNIANMHRDNVLTQTVNTARKAQVEFKKQVQEWKNLLLRGNDPANFTKYSEAFVKQSEVTQTNLQQLKKLFAQLDLDTKMVDEALTTHQELQGKYLDALKKYDQADQNSAHIVDTLVNGMDRPPTQKIDGIVDFILAKADSLVAESEKDAQARYQFSSRLLWSGILLALVLGGTITYWLIRGITRPLLQAVNMAQTAASGDLTSKITVNGTDEIGLLMKSLKEMNQSLSNIVNEVRGGTDAIHEASSEIATGNLDLSARTEAQAGSIEETASSMEELTSNVRQNAGNASEASRMAIVASEVASKGGSVVSQVIEMMASINESSKKIVDIIGVIDGIAFQTNILALNAAVEAARAGEQGRGFAVVASEVRNLAQRSASAAKEIKTLINDSVSKVEAGAVLVNQAGNTMVEVVESVKRVSDVLITINSTNHEQNTEIEQISQAISQMDNVTQQNAALVEQAAAATESLQEQAQHLTAVVSVFVTHKNTNQAAATKRIGSNLKLIPG
ncbi:methyl-accepting chemotaxis protein [Undibacterium sp. RTI2.1]|uniref:methyl-accepting chemotaxis protein n=1 Tax=unclassified Undibacterium TaxID=2630295 RepID=UPI002AB40242|nr:MULTISPECIES: methyl-accepting chemotaxis protein [unclassified Undibacterium]MDY7539075.1 methyl-accepting chemotaxis protein [Undibacterium sp. 5I1]MEB0031000.1 methyl-accepting chemotaxis protein [Undibacterium sp. RTI2.1]MEB0115847.1 methyl-accepting chemotaxis protein [Undibacterium sp. RTI2.2]MEB0229791.1 methyl-accepting chemotaxis protein [Undibacterium sp. 10I3]MEB0258304.1 methyl-accepting chemotaxis protein [Undibacterium sp. 5I1]